jgi:hypothetical protein
MHCHFEERENALCDYSFVGMTIMALFKLRYAKSPDFATNKHIHKLTKNQLAPKKKPNSIVIGLLSFYRAINDSNRPLRLGCVCA